MTGSSGREPARAAAETSAGSDLDTERPAPVIVQSLGFRTDVMLLECGGSVVIDRGPYLVVRTSANPGFRWGNYLLFPEPPRPGDEIKWPALFDAEFPQASHRAFGVDGTAGETGGPAAHRALGVTAEVNTVLIAQKLGPPRTAPQAEVRALIGDEDWAQAYELHVACYGVPSDDETRLFTQRQVAGYRYLCEAGHGRWIGAFVGGRLRAAAGLFTLGFGLARYQNVQTHPDFRRRGLASAVLRHAGRQVLDGGRAHTLVIVADPDEEAIHLYRALGFTDAERQVQLQGEQGEP
ncbi:MAG TPA: N-acetyltransferase [Actinocrinis sp.]|nr:N-acetyltransferase [Actinocrinis sp.]